MCIVQLRFYICVQITEGITSTALGDVTRRENKTIQIDSDPFMALNILLQTFKLKKNKMFVVSFFLLFSMKKIIIIILLTTNENILTYAGSYQGKITVTFTRFLSHECVYVQYVK